uniref:YagK/YfjJ domain-containing protein n=1 Tax=Aeromonas salmonicida TaxID=645 RepID=UPI0013A6E2BD
QAACQGIRRVPSGGIGECRTSKLNSRSNFDADNMATRIRKAWCRALRLAYPDYASLVHFPPDAEYRFDRRDADLHNDNFYDFLVRIGYFFKLRSKVEGGRNYGRSERIR